ncbi:hypothetical protein QSH57_003198 [Fusarium oxysporum f. sp. vasinfectum]|nr:hypothetical protein QSH57_003198 [Fusarium oxysporum f. sp. vasinfectum]
MSQLWSHDGTQEAGDEIHEQHEGCSILLDLGYLALWILATKKDSIEGVFRVKELLIRQALFANEVEDHLRIKVNVISDGVHTFDSGKYGQRSIQFGNAAYQTFAATATTWFQKPYQHLLPYIQKVDSLGDNILHYVNKQFPIIKKPTQELYNDTKGLVSLLYHKALEGRDHVLKVYDSEYKKNKQVGLVAHGKAAVTTVLGVSNEALLAQLPFAPEEGRGNQYRLEWSKAAVTGHEFYIGTAFTRRDLTQ